MASKSGEINLFKEKNNDWFDNKDLKKYRGNSKWLKKYKPVIYSVISCGFLTMASLQIWAGMSFLLFLFFFAITIISIVIDSRNK